MKTKAILLAGGILLGTFTSCQSSNPSETNKEKTETTDESKKDIEHLTVASFKQKVFNYEGATEWKFEGDKPCIVDFYASWCGPCRMMAPTIAEIAQQYKGKIDVYKVNVDDQKELAAAFGISSIPSILFCPGEGRPQMSAGMLSKADFDKAINEVLLK
jgi:thioredoxin